MTDVLFILVLFAASAGGAFVGGLCGVYLGARMAAVAVSKVVLGMLADVDEEQDEGTADA